MARERWVDQFDAVGSLKAVDPEATYPDYEDASPKEDDRPKMDSHPMNAEAQSPTLAEQHFDHTSPNCSESGPSMSWSYLEINSGYCREVYCYEAQDQDRNVNEDNVDTDDEPSGNEDPTDYYNHYNESPCYDGENAHYAEAASYEDQVNEQNDEFDPCGCPSEQDE